MNAPAPNDAGGLGPVGRRLPTVPADGVAGRSLVALVAILAFLAALAAGIAALVAASSSAWRGDLVREATIQVRPVAGRSLDQDVARAVALAASTRGVLSAKALSRRDAESLLEPWLGRGIDLADLPVPRLVALVLDPDARPDLRALGTRLATELPSATLDDHAAWLSRLAVAAGAIVALAIGAVLLVLAASAVAIGFATRGAMAGHRDVVEVLHFVGADDRFIARAFARRFARLGLVGGAIGAGCAACLVAFGPRLGVAYGGGGAPEAEALLGAFEIGAWTYGAIALVPIANGIVAGLVTGAYVKRFLKATYRK